MLFASLSLLSFTVSLSLLSFSITLTNSINFFLSYFLPLNQCNEELKNNRLDQWPNIDARTAAEILKDRKILHAELWKSCADHGLRSSERWLEQVGKCTTNCKAYQSDSLHEKWTLKEKRIWHEGEESASLKRGKKNRKVTKRR